jgi:DNA-binding IscR family transcriptional regulator
VLDEAAAAFFAVLDSYTLEDLVGQASTLADLLQLQIHEPATR